MKFHALFLMFLTLSCSDQHSHIYIHNKQIYATSEVSEFDVDHYSQRANSNFLILNDSESIKDDVRKTKLENLCKSYQLTCQRLNLSKSLETSSAKIIETHNDFAGRKYFVFSPSAEVTAQYTGTLLLKKEGKQTFVVDAMLKSLGVDGNQALREKIMKLKTQEDN